MYEHMYLEYLYSFLRIYLLIYTSASYLAFHLSVCLSTYLFVNLSLSFYSYRSIHLRAYLQD